MKILSRIWFPATVTALAAAGIMGFGKTPGERLEAPSQEPVADTVVYTPDAYKLNRRGDFTEIAIADSLLDSGSDSLDFAAEADTLPRLTARDTVKAPDSLRLTDPFRYKWYVALVDSLTHVQVRDSLHHSSDSLKVSADTLKALFLKMHNASDSLKWSADSLHSRLDSLTYTKIDSIYIADSAATARAIFEAWYWSLSRKERRKYDAEQLLPIKLAEMDSLRKIKQEKQDIRDSIIENTPRILETFALPDSLFYKRMVVWQTDPDFQKITPVRYDTSFNYRFYDYPFLRKDVNANWLGVAGSPTQYYNYFLRESRERVPFYDALESWSCSPSDMLHFNTKVAYTELCYFGTLLGNSDKESDNLHIFTTQNITPALNFSILFDRFGGGGMLENEETRNKTFAVGVNYLGKKYLMHAGYISNSVSHEENGGIQDNSWIRDTTVEFREIDVALKSASSKTEKKTFFLEQELRVPFNFINEWKARKDTNFVYNADSLDRDITTAFVGHSSEFSTYGRSYTDDVSSSNTFASNYYNNTFNFKDGATADSMGVRKFDNKLFIRLQPWSEDAVVSKLDIGIGDKLMNYFDSTSVRPTTHKENSMYLYAGAEGQMLDGYVTWDAKGKYTLLGDELADFELGANASLKFYPFRKARKSPVSVRAHFSSTLLTPSYYERRLQSNHYSWDNEFGKASTTRIQGEIDIPHWRMNATVGYALLANNTYYDTLGIVRQNPDAMSVLSASLRKEFVFGPLHLDNRALLQFSSNRNVVPVPTLALNLKWYFEFVAQKNEAGDKPILTMQIGANAYWNTKWYSPAWNPALGVFHTQNKNEYTNGPYFDVFINMQWKRAVIFLKYQNAGAGWPMRKYDFFSGDHYIVTGNGMDGLKLGIYWPFYLQPGRSADHSADHKLSSAGR